MWHTSGSQQPNPDTAAVVGRARYRRVTWGRISSILHISEDTARHRYTERYILRRLARFARSGSVPDSLPGLYGTTPLIGTEPPLHAAAATHCAEVGAGEGPPVESTSTEPSGAAYNRLSPILSMLIRTAQLSNKEVSTRIGCSASYLSRILAGERVPTWELTRKFARACGADPDVLQAVWESEKLSRKCRDATVVDPSDTPLPATDRLHIAVQTLHVRAGRPAPHDIAVASRWSLDAAAAASVLESASLPDRTVLTTFVRLLGGSIDYFNRLLDDALQEVVQSSEHLDRPEPAPWTACTSLPKTDTNALAPSPAGADEVLRAFSKAYTEQQTVEDGRARLLQKHAKQQRPNALERAGLLQMLADRGRTRSLAATTETLRHRAAHPAWSLPATRPGT